MAKSRIPAGYEDEEAFIAEARERFQQGVDFDRENRDEALQDLKFFAGEQWDESAKAARAKRPMLTINQLPSFVAQVVGDIRINRPAIRVRPAEDADKDLAEVREGLIRAIERDCDAQGVYAETGQSQVACGIGNFRITLDYASDDGFDRDIRIQAIPNPLSVIWDPMSTERTGKDAGWCFVDDEMPRKEFEKRFKDETGSSLEVPLHDTNGWYTRDTVRVTEYWIVKQTEVELALLDGGKVVELAKVPKGVTPLKTRKTLRKTACAYLITGKTILSGPVELPIDRVPIIRVRGWEVNVGTKRVRFGLVRFARDPQRLKNYWRSISAEMLALAPKGKWLVHESAEGDSEEFRTAQIADDPVLIWTGQIPPQYIAPPTLNSAVLQESQLNAQDMKDVTGLHDASLGAKSNETSGKAIMARQKEGDVSTYIYHDNLQAGIREGGRIVNALIPITYDTARTIRTLGEDEATKIQRINDPNNPDSVDINKGRYDVVVETGPSYSTKRAESAESMMQFVQAVPAAAQITGDLIAQAQDWPMADKIAERLKKALPPGVAEEDEDPSPEQQQAKAQAAEQAQQQQQMQQRAATLQLDEQEAKVAQMRANATKTMAEAQALQNPAPEAGPQGDHVDMPMKLVQLRTAEAQALEAEAKAESAQIKVQSDRMDLARKPTQHALEDAHQDADLDAKLNPPEAEASQPPKKPPGNSVVAAASAQD
jgi:hypothetical protein